MLHASQRESAESLGPFRHAFVVEVIIIGLPAPNDVPPTGQPARHGSFLRGAAGKDLDIHPPFQLSVVVGVGTAGLFEDVEARRLVQFFSFLVAFRAALPGVHVDPMVAVEFQRYADVECSVAANVPVLGTHVRRRFYPGVLLSDLFQMLRQRKHPEIRIQELHRIPADESVARGHDSAVLPVGQHSRVRGVGIGREELGLRAARGYWALGKNWFQDLFGFVSDIV
jgi:hypothetical protein